MKGKPKMKTTIETLSKKWKRPIYKISEVIRIYEEEEFVEEIILEEVNQNTPKETFTLKDAANYAKDIYDQYGLNVDRVDFREKEIIFGEWKELDEDDRDYIGACADKLFLCDENDQYGWRSYLYNLEDEKDIFNIDKNVLYLMKKGRLIDIENKEIENKIYKIVTVKDVKGKERRVAYTWNEKKKEYRAKSYPEEDVQKILEKYPDDEEYLYGFSLEKWINRGCLGRL